LGLRRRAAVPHRRPTSPRWRPGPRPEDLSCPLSGGAHMPTTDADLTPLGAHFLAWARGEGSGSTTAQILERLRPAVREAPDDTVVTMRARTPVSRLDLQRRLVREDRPVEMTPDLAVLAYAVGLLEEQDVDALLQA